MLKQYYKGYSTFKPILSLRDKRYEYYEQTLPIQAFDFNSKKVRTIKKIQYLENYKSYVFNSSFFKSIHERIIIYLQIKIRGASSKMDTEKSGELTCCACLIDRKIQLYSNLTYRVYR